MPLQFGDPGLAEAMLHGSSLGIDAARLELSQRAEAARRAEIAQEQALRNREQTFRETEFNTRRSDDAAARDSMLSQIEGTAQMPAPQGDEGDFFAQPTPVTGPITPEMRGAPAHAIEPTFHAAMSQVQHQRAIQEESDRQWGMYRNLRKQGLARMVSPETYDKAVAAGVVWAPEDAPPERRPIDMAAVLQHLTGGAGPMQMQDFVGPQAPEPDMTGVFRMDHGTLGTLARMATQKPRATTADWLAAGASPAQAASFARLGGTVEDVERFATHKMTVDEQERRAKDKAEPTEPEIESLMTSHPREFPDRESAKAYIVQKKGGLVNELRAPNDNTEAQGHAKWTAEAIGTALKTAEDERKVAENRLKDVQDPRNAASDTEIEAAKRDFAEKHATVVKLREQLIGVYERLAGGTGGRNPPNNRRPARETAPIGGSPGTAQGTDVSKLMDANPPLDGETEDQYVARINALRSSKR